MSPKPPAEKISLFAGAWRSVLLGIYANPLFGRGEENPDTLLAIDWSRCRLSCWSRPRRVPMAQRRLVQAEPSWRVPVGSGLRYMICVTLFCTLRESENTRTCENRVRFSHVRVFSDSRNVQKRATKFDTSGHCLSPGVGGESGH